MLSENLKEKSGKKYYLELQFKLVEDQKSKVFSVHLLKIKIKPY